MVTIRKNKSSGNYVLKYKGKKYVHANKTGAVNQAGAIKSVETKRRLRSKLK